MSESTEGHANGASEESAHATLLRLARERIRALPFRDIELSFEDGNILLQTQNTLQAQNTIFKVYKGPLVRHSPVFKDMLDFPQPPQTEEDTSGSSDSSLISVTLFDSAYDIRCLLRVLMPNKRFKLSGVVTTSFDDVCACLRMAHKYQIDRLFDEALRSLRNFYPDTYPLFKSMELSPNPARAISVINLAHLVEAPTLLPMAIAECCTLGPEIMNGYKRPDRAEDHLSPSDIGLCFQAKDRLIEARVRAFHQLFEPGVRQGCTAQDVDDTTFDRFYWELLDGVVPGLYTPKIWDSFTGYLSARIPGVCEACKRSFVAADVVQQERIFDRLPELVGVTVEQWGTPPRRRWRPRNIFFD